MAPKRFMDFDAETLARIHNQPKCFTDRQWKEWNETCGCRPPALDTFCTDCTQGYKYEMNQAGKCVWPDVKFRFDKDGFIEGYRQSLRTTEKEAA